MAQCTFSGFIQKDKKCPYPAHAGGDLCIWHDPDVRKDTPDIRQKLQAAIQKTGKDMEGFLLRGADLSGMDFSGANMKDIDLREARLDAANLSGADLRGAKLNRVSAVGANFENANLMAASLSFGNFTNANFRGVNFRIVHVEYANFVGADFEGSDKRHTQFINVKMGDAPARVQPAATPNVFEQPTHVSMPAEQTPLFEPEEVGGFQQQQREQYSPRPGGQAPPSPAQPASPVQEPRPTAETASMAAPSVSPRRRNYLLISAVAGVLVGVFCLVILVAAVLLKRPPAKEGSYAPVPPAASGTAGKTEGPKPAADVQQPKPPVSPEEKQPPSEAVKTGEEIARLKKELEEAAAAQRKTEEAYRAAKEDSSRLLAELEKTRRELSSALQALRDRVADAEKREGELRKKLAEAEKRLAAAKKEFEEREKGLKETIALLGRKLAAAEKAFSEKKGTFENFAHVIAQLRETNDGLVKEYEKKLREYRAKIARLSQWYERDKSFTRYNYDHFLIGWDKYTVVGSPSGAYVVGVKFKRTSSHTVTTDMFMLGIKGASQPVFQVVIFDPKGNRIKVDLKTMANRVIGKGEVLTVSKKWSTPVPPRYFSVDFIQ